MLSLSRLPFWARLTLIWTAIASMAAIQGMADLMYNMIYRGAREFLETRGGYSSKTLAWYWAFGASIYRVGALGAGLGFNALQTRLGRVGCLVLGQGGMMISLCICSLTNFTAFIELMIVGRLALGFFMGIQSNGTTLFLHEISPERQQARYNGINFGIRFAAMLFEIILGSPHVFSTAASWVWLILIPAMIGLPGLFLLPLLQSTPLELIAERRISQAIDSEKFYTGKANIFLTEEQSTTRSDKQNSAHTNYPIWQILRRNEHTMSFAAVLSLCGCTVFGGKQLLMDYLIRICELLGIAQPFSTNIAALALVGPVSIAAGLLFDRIGWKVMVFVTTALMSIFMTGVMVLRFINASHSSTSDTETGVLSIAAAFLVVFWALTCIGTLLPMKVMIADLLPFELKSTGFSLYMVVNGLLSMFVEQLFDPLERYHPGSGFSSLVVWFSVSAIALCFTTSKAFLKKDTRSMSQQAPGSADSAEANNTEETPLLLQRQRISI